VIELAVGLAVAALIVGWFLLWNFIGEVVEDRIGGEGGFYIAALGLLSPLLLWLIRVLGASVLEMLK